MPNKINASFFLNIVKLFFGYRLQILILLSYALPEPLLLDIALDDREHSLDGIVFWRVNGIEDDLETQEGHLISAPPARMDAEPVHEESDLIERMSESELLYILDKLICVDALVELHDQFHSFLL